jgi:S-adenosylmethionine:tRNA ribosyltransferase-isomerase
MVLDRAEGTRRHSAVDALPRLLEKGSCLVFNNSRVRKARLIARAAGTGGATEFLLLERLDAAGLLWNALVSRAKRRREGSRYAFAAGLEAEITAAPDTDADSVSPAADAAVRTLRFDTPVTEQWLEAHGRVPLPPYIRRADDEADSDRYQTVYARPPGSAAAPTAGLHFTESLLARLAAAGIGAAFLTLHVGLGTFLPVRAENLEDHRMHEEAYTIGEDAAARVEQAKREGHRVIAVGTTSLRALESAWRGGALARGEGRTSLFIYPGYRFQAVDGLFTNFHTPFSTLLMLAAAFAGKDFLLESYREAVNERYRFFSYGDAMLIL